MYRRFTGMYFYCMGRRNMDKTWIRLYSGKTSVHCLTIMCRLLGSMFGVKVDSNFTFRHDLILRHHSSKSACYVRNWLKVCISFEVLCPNLFFIYFIFKFFCNAPFGQLQWFGMLMLLCSPRSRSFVHFVVEHLQGLSQRDITTGASVFLYPVPFRFLLWWNVVIYFHVGPSVPLPTSSTSTSLSGWLRMPFSVPQALVLNLFYWEEC